MHVSHYFDVLWLLCFKLDLRPTLPWPHTLCNSRRLQICILLAHSIHRVCFVIHYMISIYFLTEFRECFYLFARSGQITTLDELTVIMRSLGLSPTIQELINYLKKKGGKMSFADFLEVMHQHSKVENLPDEVIGAFKAADPQNTGLIPARQLRTLLQTWGEGLSVREVIILFLLFYVFIQTYNSNFIFFKRLTIFSVKLMLLVTIVWFAMQILSKLPVHLFRITIRSTNRQFIIHSKISLHLFY